VQLVALQNGRPRPGPVAPANHLRLFVQMPIEQHGAIAATGNLEKQQRRATGQAQHFDAQPWLRLRAAPALRQCDGGLHVTVNLPGGVEGGRLAGNADVPDQPGADLTAPLVRAEAVDRSGAHHPPPPPPQAGWMVKPTTSKSSPR